MQAEKSSDEFMYTDLPVIIVCILGVISNVLLLVAFIKDPLKCFRNSGTYLVMNLSLSDCLTCSLLSFSYIKGINSLSYSIVISLALWCGLGSTLSIISISIDRFLMVVYPIQHRILMNGKVKILWLAVIWTVSCVIPGLRFLYANNREEIDKNTMYPFSIIVVILSAVMYASTYYTLKKQSRKIPLHNSNENRAQKIRILKEKQFLKTVMIIACVAFFCAMPSIIFFQIFPSFAITNSTHIYIFQKIFAFIYFINFAVNPLIYVVRLPNYRKTFYLLYCRRSRPFSVGQAR